MVWIHGGGFISESASPKVYGPQYLMSQDIVLVSINYRLGVLGFLSLEDVTLDVPGNAGLKDQNFALKWVQGNIGCFGGDKNNVTIFGHSAGAASVHFHILSPSSKGLFHKAIMESGVALNPWSWGRSVAMELLVKLDRYAESEKEALDILQSVSCEELYNAQEQVYDVSNFRF